jgi:hypothetical protein
MILPGLEATDTLIKASLFEINHSCLLAVSRLGGQAVK